MAQTSKIIQIETKDFFDNYFFRFEAIAGRNREELFPENIDNYVLMNPDKFQDRLREADKIVYCTGKAINECEDVKRKPYRTILVDYYLKQMMNKEVAEAIGYSLSRYSILKTRALMEFADSFNYWIAQQDVKPVFKLVYKKKQSRGGRPKKAQNV